jgi:hypothetical protein
MAAWLIDDAALAAARGDDERQEAALRALVALLPGGGADSRPGSVVEMAMTAALVRTLRSAWEGGWQPADIVRAARKKLGRSFVAVAESVLVVDARTSAGPGVPVPEPWAAQLRQIAEGVGDEIRWADLEELRCGARLLGLLMYLPVLPCLLPPPSKWGRSRPRSINSPPTNTVDSRMLTKVRALLAKAESTDFEEEANSLTAKAQELMARHAIDQAMIADSRASDDPCGRRIGIDDPYADGKVRLLSEVAAANRCRSVWMAHFGFSTVFGFPGDLDNVEVLYTSLLVQATRAMTAAGTVRDTDGRSRTRSFRQSFLVAFAHRIGERLKTATSQATEAAGAVHGDALLPVLAGRRVEVDDAVAAAYPELVFTRTRAVSNWDGWVAGRVAADQALLGPEQQLLPGVAV